jgi:predicted nuclease of predicted toxin-antitoxin system
MKALVDSQLPIALAIHLRQRGHDCQHVLEIGLDESNDLAIWSHALKESRVIVSKDEDFVFLANRPGDGGRLIWVRLGNCRNTVLMAAFDRVLERIVEAIDSGQRIVEIR